MCSLCRLPVAKNHNFGQICTDRLLPMRAKIGALWHTHGVRLRAKFRLDQFILLPSGGENPQILPFFGLWPFVVLPIGNNVKKVELGAQLRTKTSPI